MRQARDGLLAAQRSAQQVDAPRRAGFPGRHARPGAGRLVGQRGAREQLLDRGGVHLQMRDAQGQPGAGVERRIRVQIGDAVARGRVAEGLAELVIERHIGRLPVQRGQTVVGPVALVVVQRRGEGCAHAGYPGQAGREGAQLVLDKIADRIAPVVGAGHAPAQRAVLVERTRGLDGRARQSVLADGLLQAQLGHRADGLVHHIDQAAWLGTAVKHAGRSLDHLHRQHIGHIDRHAGDLAAVDVVGRHA